jgi:hypothetical protein
MRAASPAKNRLGGQKEGDFALLAASEFYHRFEKMGSGRRFKRCEILPSVDQYFRTSG